MLHLRPRPGEVALDVDLEAMRLLRPHIEEMDIARLLVDDSVCPSRCVLDIEIMMTRELFGLPGVEAIREQVCRVVAAGDGVDCAAYPHGSAVVPVRLRQL